MATLLELKAKFTDSNLQDKVEAALIIAVQAVLDAPARSPDQQRYAAAVFANPRAEAGKALKSVLAANAGATIAQIDGATDAAIQADVNDVIDTLTVAYNASLVAGV